MRNYTASETERLSLLERAVDLWVAYGTTVGHADDFDEYEGFARFIGYPTQPGDKWIVDIDNPEVVRILEMLNGPHAKTILKMLELKRAA